MTPEIGFEDAVVHHLRRVPDPGQVYRVVTT
jgi:hypothetical protein